MCNPTLPFHVNVINVTMQVYVVFQIFLLKIPNRKAQIFVDERVFQTNILKMKQVDKHIDINTTSTLLHFAFHKYY